MKQILEILENDSRISPEQIAVMIDSDVETVKAKIAKMESDGIIVGYKTLINWDAVEDDKITALIELKVALQREEGFDKVAQRIYQFPHVKTLWLMSGAFDIALIVEGKSIKEIALFVAEKLAVMEAVTASGTHFVLKTYKDSGVIFDKKEKDKRGVIVL